MAERLEATKQESRELEKWSACVFVCNVRFVYVCLCKRLMSDHVDMYMRVCSFLLTLSPYVCVCERESYIKLFGSSSGQVWSRPTQTASQAWMMAPLLQLSVSLQNWFIVFYLAESKSFDCILSGLEIYEKINNTEWHEK